MHVRKTNRKNNADQIISVEDEEKECLDFEKDIYEPMIKYLKKKITYPSFIPWDEKDFEDADEFFEEKVLTFIDDVINNLDNDGKFNQKDMDKNGKENKKKDRRLGEKDVSKKKLNKGRKLQKVEKTQITDNRTSNQRVEDKTIKNDGEEYS